MKYILGDAARLMGGYIPLIPPRFAPMLIDFPKNIGKSRDKSYPTDQKASSILDLLRKASSIFGHTLRCFFFKWVHCKNYVYTVVVWNKGVARKN